MKTEPKPNEIPFWQQITGLTPEAEEKLSPTERDRAVRKLINKTKDLARDEFARAEECPAGERSIFWDPLEAVCRKLEISRTKLSSFSRELTGLRAHEQCDRIKAEKLPEVLTAYVEKWLHEELYARIDQFDAARLHDKEYRSEIAHAFSKQSRQRRKGHLAAAWAAALDYANPSRLKRACLVQFRKSLDHLEFEIIENIVQKFFDELLKTEPQKKSAPANAGKAQAPAKKIDETPPPEAEMKPERTGVS